jgi:hypothetical protein
VIAHPGEFERAWEARNLLSQDALARWDLSRKASSGGHNWLTRSLVKVDATILDPDAGAKPLAPPFVVVLGAGELADRFPSGSIEVREQARLLAAGAGRLIRMRSLTAS